jgi:2,4-dienoyl-CoA reductase-like NADH-dependent reductase (Old Yellow Enzyme family)
MTSLFEPLQIGPLKLPNRIVMAPLTRGRAEPSCESFCIDGLGAAEAWAEASCSVGCDSPNGADQASGAI